MLATTYQLYTLYRAMDGTRCDNGARFLVSSSYFCFWVLVSMAFPVLIRREDRRNGEQMGTNEEKYG